MYREPLPQYPIPLSELDAFRISSIGRKITHEANQFWGRQITPNFVRELENHLNEFLCREFQIYQSGNQLVRVGDWSYTNDANSLQISIDTDALTTLLQYSNVGFYVLDPWDYPTSPRNIREFYSFMWKDQDRPLTERDPHDQVVVGSHSWGTGDDTVTLKTVFLGFCLGGMFFETSVQYSKVHHPQMKRVVMDQLYATKEDAAKGHQEAFLRVNRYINAKTQLCQTLILRMQRLEQMSRYMAQYEDVLF